MRNKERILESYLHLCCTRDPNDKEVCQNLSHEIFTPSHMKLTHALLMMSLVTEKYLKLHKFQKDFRPSSGFPIGHPIL